MAETEQAIRQQAMLDGVTHFATGIAVVRDNRLLVVRRVPEDSFGGAYELPGGGVDDGETFEQGALRELAEETGLTTARILGTFPGFDYATRSKSKVRQINFIVEVEPGNVVLEPKEHDAFRWIIQDDLETLGTTESMKACLHQAFAALVRLEDPTLH